MKVLVINYEFPPIGGGAGKVTERLAEKLVKKGFKITVLTSGYKNLSGMSINRGIKILRLKTLRSNIGYSSTLEKISFIISALFIINTLVNMEKPNLIHAHFAIPSGIVAYYIKRRYSIPYIITSHGGDIPGFSPEATVYFRLFNWFFKKVWRSADAIIALNDELANKVRRIYKPEKVEVIPNGIDIVYKKCENRKDTYFRILYVGRYSKQKNLGFLISALKDLKESNWELFLIGDGPERGELEKLIRLNHMNDRVHLLPWMSRDELSKFYCMSDVFCIASINEGIPVAGLEAMANGLAIVASNNGGNRQIVEDGVNGFLFELGDKQDLINKLGILMNDKLKLRKMQKESMKRAMKFDWEKIAEQYSEIYEKYSS